MRRYLLAALALALFATISLTACGTAATSTAPTATLSSSSSSSSSLTQTVTVVLTDTGITASSTAFRPGVRCHFVVTNNGTTAHEFLIMPPGMVERMGQMPMAQWHQQALYTTGMIGPGMMATFDYTFGSMPMMQAGQSAAFGCYADGRPFMHIPITVQP